LADCGFAAVADGFTTAQLIAFAPTAKEKI